MKLEKRHFLFQRFELIKDYPNCPFCIGDVLDAYEFEGSTYIKTGDNKIYPKQFPDNFKSLRWWEHRTIEQLASIKYAKVVSDPSNYYVKGDIVEVLSFCYNNDRLVGGKNDILFNLKGHHFTASQLEPATKEEHDKFWAKENSQNEK